MKLSQLLKAVAVKQVADINGGPRTSSCGRAESCGLLLDISSIHCRAQDVQPGGLFVAIPGFKADGHDFIDQALAKGASAVVSQKPVEKASIVIQVENTRKALSAIAAQFYGNPSERMTVIGITGTNGKTTTAYLIESILSKAGFSVGVIGTINYRYAGKSFQNPVTTPESLDLQRILAEMLEHGVTHVVMEVSSHAIDLFRIDSCRFDIGVFTNLTQDHLDYHADMNAYWSCKKKLFTELLSSGPKKHKARAVINGDDAKGKELIKDLSIPILSVGRGADRSVRPLQVRYDLTGISGQLSTPEGEVEFHSPLVGAHNLQNILCAAAVGAALGLAPETLKEGIEALCFVPGRLEHVPDDRGRFVYVDYAHTPDALKNALNALRPMTAGRMICVFGCGGDRDQGKRPQMGEIAGTFSDLAVITSDNPRTESPLKIIDQILCGVKKVPSFAYRPSDLTEGFTQKGFVAEPDRQNAIRLGIKVSRPGDIVLIAGKGHETYQIIGGKTIPFDDRQEAKKALSSQSTGNRSASTAMMQPVTVER